VQAQHLFNGLVSGQFEIILVPNGGAIAGSPVLKQCESLAKKFSQVKVVAIEEKGKGRALQQGFRHSTGDWIFFTDADLPYRLSFFKIAKDALEKGTGLVAGNRRLPESRFNVPTTALRLVYRRYVLGKLFNSFLRLSFSEIKTHDTQAGIKAMTRSLAERAFSRQLCPGFLFDIEIFIHASVIGAPILELPVELYLDNEKSTVRILKEIFACGYWMIILKLNQMKGYFS